MSRIVVMDEELHESITVVDIPASFIRAVEAGHHPPYLYLMPPMKLSASAHFEPTSDTVDLPPRVRLRLERVMRGRDPKPLFWYAYADDPSLAMSLRAAFLPGQLNEVQRREREAFWRGAFAALEP